MSGSRSRPGSIVPVPVPASRGKAKGKRHLARETNPKSEIRNPKSELRRPRSVVLKLGGSVITFKSAGEPRVRWSVLRRLAAEIAAARPERLVVVHGAGGFGHPMVERTGIHRGVRNDADRLAWAETQCWQNVLDVQVAATLCRAGIPAVPCQPSAAAVLRDGRLERMDLWAVEGMVGAGMTPVLFGVPAFDRVRGCAILSGDAIAPFVAARLGFDLVVHATDVDGVYEADPRKVRGARRFRRIDRRSWPSVRGALGRCTTTDVTGGMLGKVVELVAWARRGVRARIVDARNPGRVRGALAGRGAGTLVEW